MTQVGLITNNNESAYREETQHLTKWCSGNNLDLNTSKTKELIVDFWKSKRTELSALYMHREEVERVESFKLLGVHISADLTRALTSLIRWGRPNFLRKLKLAHLPQHLLTNFYRWMIENLLAYCCTVWFSSCRAQDRKDLQWVVRAEHVIGKTLPPLRDIYTGRLQKKASWCVSDICHGPRSKLWQ